MWVWLKAHGHNFDIFGNMINYLFEDDPRIRTIPFATRRPTFKEIRRVQEELSRVHILGKKVIVLFTKTYLLSEWKPKEQYSMLRNISNRNTKKP